MMKAGLAVALAGLALAACNKTEQAKEAVRPVVVMLVEPQTTETFGPFASVVEARFQTQLGFQIAGRMIARDVYVGDFVRKGQRLAALDPTVVRLAFERAKAETEDAKAQLENASGVESRQRILASGGNASQAVLDNAVAGRSTAKARLDQASAALRNSQDQINYTELRASFEGVVTVWNAEVGQVVSNGQSVVTIARPDDRDAVVDITDDAIGRVRPGLAFVARLQSAPSITAMAVVREIGPLADPATRTHRVRLSLAAPPAAFRIGTTVAVSIENTTAPRIVIPTRAIVEKDAASFVWILSTDGKSVNKRAVTIAERNGETCIIGSGLSAGDKVVTVGVHSLSEGQAVAGEQGKGGADARTEGTRP